MTQEPAPPNALSLVIPEWQSVDFFLSTDIAVILELPVCDLSYEQMPLAVSDLKALQLSLKT